MPSKTNHILIERKNQMLITRLLDQMADQRPVHLKYIKGSAVKYNGQQSGAGGVFGKESVQFLLRRAVSIPLV